MRTSFSFALTPEQFASSVIGRGRKARPHGGWRALVQGAWITQWAALGFLLASAYGHRTVPGHFVLYGALVAMVASAMVGFASASSVRATLRRSTYITLPRTLSIEAEGIRQRSDAMDSLDRWSAISAVEEQGGFVYVVLDLFHFYAIPVSAFESATEKDEFVATVQSKLSVPTAATFPAAAPAPPRRISWRRGAMDALRLAFFLPVPEERLRPTWARILALALVTLALPTLPALWSLGPSGHWAWYALPAALYHVPLILLFSIVAAYATRQTEVARIFYAGLIAYLAIDIITSLIAYVGLDAGAGHMLARFGWIPPAWIALALATYAARLVEPGVGRLGAVIAAVVLVALPLATTYRGRILWQAPFDPAKAGASAGARSGAGSEDAFYAQAGVLARDLDAVRPGKRGVMDVFFIGMAGYGPEDVFMREVKAVGELMRQRFGAEGHTIQLINNPKSLLDTPIASKTSLAAALKRVSEVMDKDEDVLVLFMTSHGSEDHRFSLDLWPLRFHEIDPAMVRRLLDESGIRNRVVIVSACYSGGFVEPLRDPGTLVITASAADKNSFGCSNTAQWTYFGKAYFDEALRGTHSFAKAFDVARPAIARREIAEKFDPSEPQIAMGALIARKLEALEAQLDSTAAAENSGNAPKPAVEAR